ncbi:MAG TPA: PfkB family carbohydrate kinase [Solirubrobacteraceae bacterium]|nr:PfkB family carbohydrate kinase [Solirubrobacteraceae bacterium]
MTRVAVVGHVEWMEFARVPRLPAPGDIVHASEVWEEAGGGGAVAAVQLAKLGGGCDFFTALGDDERARRSAERLAAHGVRVHAAARHRPQRRGFTHIDGDGERTITVIGERIVPHGDDPLPWELLSEIDGVYFTGGDAGALRGARRAGALVATPRADATLLSAGVRLDALVRSGSDAGEQLDPSRLDPPPRYVVTTAGGRGGTWDADDGGSGTWEAAPLPGPPRDAYGAGDSFAAALAYGLGDGRGIDGACALAALAGAHKLTGRAPYENMLEQA